MKKSQKFIFINTSEADLQINLQKNLLEELAYCPENIQIDELMYHPPKSPNRIQGEKNIQRWYIKSEELVDIFNALLDGVK